MHEEYGLQNPLDNWELKAVKRGILRQLGKPPQQKLPITIEILSDIQKTLDYTKPITNAFWAACLIVFFGFLRKSTLLPKSSSKAETAKALRISDVRLGNDRTTAWVTIRHSKTIQFGQRTVTLPFNSTPSSHLHLCPVEALITMLAQLDGLGPLPPGQPLFSYPEGHQVLHLTHKPFVAMLRQSLQDCGKEPSLYSGHSFRRGGCSHAFAAGIPAALIKLRGDWYMAI